MSPTALASTQQLLARLASVAVADTDGERIEQIAALERLKAGAAALQIRVSAQFAASQRAKLTAVGVAAPDAARSIGSQLALARRESPARGSRFLGLTDALVAEMPQTLRALARGETSEWRATLAVRETAVLSRDDRRAVDSELGPNLAGLGDAQTAREARRIGLRLDPDSARRRAEQAALGARVTLRPAPDSMSILSAVLPVADGVAAYAALRRHADLRPADGRGVGQVMASALVDRVLGTVDERDRPVGVNLHLVMTDAALLGSDHTPAEIAGYGPVPASLARRMIADAISGSVGAWVRRLVTDPVSRLVAMDSTSRRFPDGLAGWIRTRDAGVCRTPWCDAPIRHIDHIIPVSAGGATTIGNGQGLCERCNYTKQAPGWGASAGSGATIMITTPAGQEYASRPPPLPWRGLTATDDGRFACPSPRAVICKTAHRVVGQISA